VNVTVVFCEIVVKMSGVRRRVPIVIRGAGSGAEHVPGSNDIVLNLFVGFLRRESAGVVIAPS